MPEEISDQPAGGIAGDGGGDLNSIAKARESRPFGGRGGREGGGGGIERIGAAMAEGANRQELETLWSQDGARAARDRFAGPKRLR